MEKLKLQLNKALIGLAKISWIGLISVFFAVFAQASFNPQINYQGKLTDASNNVVTDGNYNFRFRLCTANLAGACSGSVVMDETYVGANKVAVASGLFSVMLGSVSSTLSSVDFNQDLYLEVQVGGSSTPAFETLSPIKRLGSVPSAFNAQKFDGLATTSFLRSDVTNAQSIFNFTTTTNATTTGSQYIGGSLVNGTLNGLAQWFNGLAGITTTPTVAGLTVSGGSSFSTLTVSSNATTSGYLTVGTAPTGALFTTGNLNVQNNGMFGGYVSSTGDLHTSANLTVQGTSAFTGLISGAGFTSAFDSRISDIWRGKVNGLASLDADGKVPIAQLSPLAITDTFVTSSEAGMLALVAQVGDVAIRLDESKSYILRVAGPTVLANWAELVFPTDAVRSVNTRTGDVTLSTDDINIGLANFYYTEARFTSSTNAVKAQPNGLASLGADGIIPAAQIGSMFLNDTFVFAATSSLLTSGATKGDIGISTDQSKTYVLKTTDPTDWANWAEILNGSSVISVNGFTGAITLTTSNITEGANQYWTSGRFNTALAAATTWDGDLFVSTGNVGIGIATTSNALEVIGNASTSNHMYVGNDLYVGYSNGANSDKIYFAAGAQSLIWNVTNSRFEFSDGLYITNNLSVSGSASSTALHVTGNATTTGYLTVGAAPSGANFTAGSLNVQDKLVAPYVSSTALTVSGNAYITGTVYAGVNNSSLGNLTSYGDSGANGGKLSLFYGATRNSTYQYWLMQPGSEVSADRFWLGTNLNNNLFTFTGGGDLSLNSGRLAVGTSTPYSMLTVWGSGIGTNKLVEFVNSASTTVLSVLENGALSAGTSTLTNLIVSNVSTSTFAGGLTVGTSQFVVQQATGNVGIGTTTPNAALQVGNATSYFKINSGNVTTTGYLTVGAAPVGANFAAGDLNVNDTAVIGGALSAGTSTIKNLIVQNNSVSTFTGGLTVNSNTLVVDAVNNSIGVATSSYSAAKLSVGGTQNTGGGAGGTGELLAIDGLLNFNSSADTGSALIIKPTVANVGSANILYGLNVDFNSITSNASQISKFAGIRVAEETTNTFGSSSIGFLYGNHPGGTTDYGLYLNSGDNNYLGTGNVGIGTTTPNAALQVGNATSYFKINSGNATTTGYLTVGAAPSGANFTAGSLNVENNVAVGGTVSSTALFVTGNATTTGTLSVRSVPYSWPSSQGAASTYLKNDGSGGLTWATVSGGSAAGSNGQIQYNSNGAFAATSSLYWDETNKILQIATSSWSIYGRGGGYLFTKFINGNDPISTLGQPTTYLTATTTYISTGIGLALAAGTAGADTYLSVGGNGGQFISPQIGGNAGNVYIAVGGSGNDSSVAAGTGGNVTMAAAGATGSSGTDGTVTVGSALGRNATFQVWGNASTSGNLIVNGGRINSPSLVTSGSAVASYLASGYGGFISGAGGAGAAVYLGNGGNGGSSSGNGGAGATTTISIGGNDQGGAGTGGAAGGVILAAGGSGGTYGNDGTVQIGNNSATGKKNAFLNVYGNVTATGNLGVGTTTPLATLEVVSASGGSSSGIKLIQAAQNAAAASSYAPIDFYVPTTGLIGQFLATAANYSNASVNLAANSVGLLSEATAGQLALIAGGASGYMTFNTGGYAAANERMRILSTGNVGIGTTTPDSLLQVGNATSYFKINSGNATTTGYLTVGAAPAGANFTAGNLNVQNNGVFGGYVTSSNLFVGATTTIGAHLVMRGMVATNTAIIIDAINGANLTVGGTWTNASDRNLKENFIPLDSQDILSKIMSLPVGRWNYKAEDSSIMHIGPVAQDFYALFGLGGSNTSISTIDPAGIALIGIKALDAKLSQQQEQINLLIGSSSPAASSPLLVAGDSGPPAGALPVSQAAAFYGTITVMGEAGFSSKVTFEREVEFKDHIIVDSDTAGTIMIAIGATSTKVVFNKQYGLMPRIVANMQSSGTPVFMPYLIADKSTTGFSIILQGIAPADLYFDWIALASKDAVGQIAGAAEIAAPATTDSAAATEPVIPASSTEQIITPPAASAETALPIAPADPIISKAPTESAVAEPAVPDVAAVSDPAPATPSVDAAQ